MSRVLLVLAVLALAGAHAAPITYTFQTACNGRTFALYQDLLSQNCFDGVPTVADTVVFPTGASVTVNSGVGSAAYQPLLAQTLRIDAGASVTFVNGMLAVEGNIFVNGTLNLLTDGNSGAGPVDDGIVQPLPDYSLPGFTPCVIGRSQHFFILRNWTGTQTVMFISGTVNLAGGLFVDVVVELSGTLSAVKGNAYFFGHVRNFGILSIGILYMDGILTNTVSGVVSIADGFEISPGGEGYPQIINNGHMSASLSADRMPVHIVNNGAMVLDDHVTKSAPDASGRITFRVLMGTLTNTGSLTLRSRRRRVHNYLFNDTVANSGDIVAEGCGLHLARDFASSGVVAARSTLPGTLLTFEGAMRNTGTLSVTGVEVAARGVVSNHGTMHLASPRVTLHSDVANEGRLTVESQRLDIHGDVRNHGTMAIAHTGSNVAVFHGDVVNQGTVSIGAAHASLAKALFNDGLFAVADTQPKRSRCFVEGQAYSTGNITVTHAHLTVTGFLHHGEPGSEIRLATRTATFTLGAWGTSLARGVARGYLRRATAADDATPSPPTCHTAPAPAAEAVPSLADGPEPRCLDTTCEACCPNSELCMIYAENIYCDGYGIDAADGAEARRHAEKFLVAHHTAAHMPPRMRRVLAATAFQLPHALAGQVRVTGPGALTTTSPLEVLGDVTFADGVEVFSMVEHGHSVAHGPNGRIHVTSCAAWYVGNDAHQVAGAPNITVGDGGALVVPRHAAVSLAAGHVHVVGSGRVRVDGTLALGPHAALHAGAAFRIAGTGKVTTTSV